MSWSFPDFGANPQRGRSLEAQGAGLLGEMGSDDLLSLSAPDKSTSHSEPLSLLGDE